MIPKNKKGTYTTSKKYCKCCKKVMRGCNLNRIFCDDCLDKKNEYELKKNRND